jgi:hypothetical protein
VDEKLEKTSPIIQTSVMAAGCVVSALVDIWADMWKFEERLFWDEIFKDFYDDQNTSGSVKIDEIAEAEELTEWKGEPLIPGFKAAVIQIMTLMAACAFAVQAMKAKTNSSEAWHFACEANHWLGILQGIISGRGMEQGTSKLAMSALGKLGANAAHAENRALKRIVFEWCDLNMKNFKSMDSAATAIAGKIVPVVFRTARSWISDWKKDRQSAGRL